MLIKTRTKGGQHAGGLQEKEHIFCPVGKLNHEWDGATLSCLTDMVQAVPQDKYKESRLFGSAQLLCLHQIQTQHTENNQSSLK